MNDMQIVKCGTTQRIASYEFLNWHELPIEVRQYFKCIGPLMDSDDHMELKVQKIYYNGGGELVNYGLNAFVRDIYCFESYSNSRVYVIYSDRFGRYYEVRDRKIAQFIYDAHLCISAEGVLLFYCTENNINSIVYATLNCKSGTTISAYNFTKPYKNNIITDIFTYDDITFVEVKGENNLDKYYYALNFSFKLFEAYGTQIYIEVHRLQGSRTDIFNNDFKYEHIQSRIEASDRLLSLSQVRRNYSLVEFKKRFGKKACCEEREKLETNYEHQIETSIISYAGDPGIDDCINSFVSHLIVLCPTISKKIGLFRRIEYHKNIIIQIDRFGDDHIHSNIPEYISISGMNLYVSPEGIILGINSNFLYVSLDGIVWKRYKLEELTKDETFYSAFISFNDGEVRLNVTLSGEKKQYFILNFKFDFWNLYTSPVEVYMNQGN